MEASNVSAYARTKKSSLIRVLDVIDTVSDWVGKFFSLLVILMVILTLLLIIQRQFGAFFRHVVESGAFYNPDEEELPFFTTFIIMYFTLGAGYTLHHNTFISFDVFEKHLSPKWQAWLRLITYPLFFLAFSFILHGAIGDLMVLLEEGEEAAFGAETELTRLEGFTSPGIFWSWVIGVSFLLLEGASRYARAILTLASGGNQNA
jgi:TRAP-type mannitol/chloroaromatic compound transport system permease small subunit